MRSAALEPYCPTRVHRSGPPLNARRRIVHEGVSPDADTGAILTPIYQSTTYIQGARPQHISRALPVSPAQPSSRRAQLALNKQGAPAVGRRRPAPPDPGAHAAPAPAESIEQYLDKGFSYARTGNPTVTAQADTCAPGPPYGTYGRRGPASRVMYVPEAQGSLPPGSHALATRPSLGRAACTVAYRVARLTLTSGDDAGEQDRQARVGVRRGVLQHGHGRHHLRHRGHDEGGPHPNPNPNPNPSPQPSTLTLTRTRARARARTMKAGDHCVITNCSYGGTNRACRTMFTDMGMSFDFIDFTDVDNIAAHIKPNTKLIFSESPANPTLTLTDIPAVSALAKARGIPHVVDSTFATPIIQRPIELGADLVIQVTFALPCLAGVASARCSGCRHG